MSAATYNITELDAGSDYTLNLQLKDSSNNPINITGATIYSNIRQDWNYPVWRTFIVTITNASSGEFSLFLAGASTDGFTPAPQNLPYKYDVLLVKTDGTRTRVLQGDVNISPAISHAV